MTLAAPDLGLLATMPGMAHRVWIAGPRPDHHVPSEAVRLRRVVQAVDPDILHLHGDKAGLAGRLVRRRGDVTVFQPHAWSFQAAQGIRRSVSLGWERVGAHLTDAVVCVGTDELELGRRAGLKTRLVLARNGVDLELLRAGNDRARAAARKLLGIVTDHPLAICVGRLHRQKNQHMLLDAWPQVTRLVPAAQLLLVGDGPDRAALERRSVPGVLFAGAVADVAPWFTAADVVVQPSRWEGMSLAVLEAMAVARSVVATDVQGMREAIGADAGTIVPVGDVAALAAAVVRRLANPAIAAAEGRAGRARVECRHDRVQQYELISGLYDELLTRRGRRAR